MLSVPPKAGRCRVVGPAGVVGLVILDVTDNRQLTTDNFFCVLPCQRHTFRYRHPACPVAQRKTGSESEFIPGSVTGGSHL